VIGPAGTFPAGNGYDLSMSTLTAKQRANLRPKEFGLPEKARSVEARMGSGNYPMPDRGHAISAIRRSAREYERGNLTKDEYDRIQRKAKKKLRKKKSKGKRKTKP
jgi:hypothetical protein